jgi:integrase
MSDNRSPGIDDWLDSDCEVAMYLYKRGKKWWLEVVIDGRRRRRSLGTSDSRLAHERATALSKAMERGNEEQEETRTARPSALIDEYVKELQRRKKSDVHISVTGTRLRWFLGEMRSLEEATPERIRKALARLAETELKGHKHKHGRRPTPKTMNAYRGALHAFFSWLVKLERWDRNPVISVARVAETGPARPRRALELAELEAFLASVPPIRGVVYRVAATTGLRRSELAALVWNDIDLSTRTLTVRAATAKNKRAAILPLSPETATALAVHRGDSRSSAPVFASIPTVETLYSDLERAGIDPKAPEGKVDLHALRATFATSLARTGAPLALAQRLMRHSTPALTANVYTRFAPHDDHAAVARLDAARATDSSVGEIVGRECRKPAESCRKPSNDSGKMNAKRRRGARVDSWREGPVSGELVGMAGGDENRTHLPGCSPGTEGLKP